jgi:hypothetical protein
VGNGCRVGYFAYTYEDVDERGEHDGPVAAEALVREPPTQQRQQLTRAGPRVEGRRRLRGALAQRPREVGDQVPGHSVEREPLRDLHRCTYAFIASRNQARARIHTTSTKNTCL